MQQQPIPRVMPRIQVQATRPHWMWHLEMDVSMSYFHSVMFRASKTALGPTPYNVESSPRAPIRTVQVR